jgi:hypothetical protein
LSRAGELVSSTIRVTPPFFSPTRRFRTVSLCESGLVVTGAEGADSYFCRKRTENWLRNIGALDRRRVVRLGRLHRWSWLAAEVEETGVSALRGRFSAFCFRFFFASQPQTKSHSPDQSGRAPKRKGLEVPLHRVDLAQESGVTSRLQIEHQSYSFRGPKPVLPAEKSRSPASPLPLLVQQPVRGQEQRATSPSYPRLADLYRPWAAQCRPKAPKRPKAIKEKNDRTKSRGTTWDTNNTFTSAQGEGRIIRRQRIRQKSRMLSTDRGGFRMGQDLLINRERLARHGEEGKFGVVLRPSGCPHPEVANPDPQSEPAKRGAEGSSCPAGTTKPVTPSCTASRTPPTSLAMTGRARSHGL